MAIGSVLNGKRETTGNMNSSFPDEKTDLS